MKEKIKLLIAKLNNIEKESKKAIIKELVTNMIIIILLKIPFDLVRDVGYNKLSILRENSLYSIIWNLVFLNIYIIVLICFIIYTFRKISSKYYKQKN